MATKYLRTFYNGHEVVAQFDDGGHTFVMNETYLRIRIRNLENLNCRTNAERKGLAFIRAHEKYVPPKK